MTTTPLERTSGSRAVATVAFMQEQRAAAEEKAVAALAEQVNVKGFRPGKAPADMVRGKVNPEAVFEEVIRILLRDALPPLVTEHKLNPIIPPKVEAVSRDPLTLKITFVERPEVAIKGEIKIEKKDVKADPKDVERVMKSLREEQRTTKAKEGASAEGDQITIDFHATDETGQEIAGLKADGYPLIIGQAHLLPGFEEQLTGLKKEEDKTFTLTLPDNYRVETLRGKVVTFHVTVKNVEEVTLPEVNDDLAKKLGLGSAAELKTKVEESILMQERQVEHMRRERELLEAITKQTKLEVAPELVEQEVQDIVRDLRGRLEEQNTSLEDWLKREGKTPQQLEEDLRKQATDRVTLRFGMAKLLEDKNIELTPEELEAAKRDFLAAVPEEHRKEAASSLLPGSPNYQELEWRARVDKLVKGLLA